MAHWGLLRQKKKNIRQLFTIILDQYPTIVSNITGLISGNYLQKNWTSTRQMFTVLLA